MGGMLQLSDSTRKLFDGLAREIGLLHGKFNIYKELSDSRIEEFGGLDSLTRILYWLLFDEICLSVSRVLDPPATAGHPNASMPALGEMLSRELPPLIIDEFGRCLDEAILLAGPFREWRNKWIAHNDLEAIRTGSDRPPIPIEKIAAELAYLASAMNIIHSKVLNYTMIYDSTLWAGQVSLLKRNLRWARDHSQCLLERSLKP
jgi:hypothetical protein